MNRWRVLLRRPWTLAFTVLVMVGVAVRLATIDTGASPTLIKPDSVSVTVNSRVIEVGFPWVGNGFCDGQFTVEVHESANEVTVGQVADHGHRGGPCAGIGHEGGHAFVDVTLAVPLGTRPVIRAIDGVPLSVQGSTSG